jgi:cell division protease FtsH
LTHLGDPRRAEEFLRYVDIRAAVGIELAEADRACRDLLEVNRTTLIAVARRLFERGSVVGTEIAALLEAARSKEALKPATPERGAFLLLVDDPDRNEAP